MKPKYFIIKVKIVHINRKISYLDLILIEPIFLKKCLFLFSTFSLIFFIVSLVSLTIGGHLWITKSKFNSTHFSFELVLR